MDLSAPASPAPPGQEHNLTHPPNRSYLLILTVVICLGVTTPMVWIRWYVSWSIFRRVTWDDYLILACWFLFIAYSAQASVALKYGLLTDFWNVSEGHAMKWLELSYAEELMYSLLIFGVKLAVLMLYKRIFVPMRGGQAWIRYIITLVIAFNAMFYTANTLVEAFNCIPRQAIWDKSVHGKCVNVYAVIIGTAALNVVSDFFIILVPMTVVWKLQIPKKRKVELSLIFGFGVLDLVFSAGRLAKSVLAKDDHNQTMALPEVALWTFGEITSCFLACCVPMVPRFVRSFRQNTNLSTGEKAAQSPTPNQNQNLQQRARSAPIRSLFSSAQRSEDGEEDPYLMYEALPFVTDLDRNISTAETLQDDGILVSRAVNISSVPKPHNVVSHVETSFRPAV